MGASLTPMSEKENRRAGESLCLEVAKMKPELGPGENEGHGAGWMSVDSGQVRPAVGCLGRSFWKVGHREKEGIGEAQETGMGS